MSRRISLGLLLGACGALASGASAQWLETAKLTAPDGQAPDIFGCAIGLSGDTAIIGAKWDDGHRGSAYVFQRADGQWTFVQKLLASDGATDDNFGSSVQVDGEMALISAGWDDARRGAVYVFERSAGVWHEVDKFTAHDGVAGDQFGNQVNLCGDLAIVGAESDDGSGAAYIFERIDGVWMEAAKLTASDRAPGDRFGVGVAISGTVAFAGAMNDDGNGADSGSVYVFEQIDGVWTEIAKLTPPDGDAGDNLGLYCSAEGDTLMAGAQNDDDSGTDAGAAYVFQRAGQDWTLVAKLTASDGAPGDRFGRWNQIHGNRALVSAQFDDNERGSTYVFERTGGVWTESAKLTATDRAPGDRFGGSLAIEGETIIVASVFDDDNGADSGSAYVFHFECRPDLTGDAWLDIRDIILFLNLWADGDWLCDWNRDGVLDTRDVNEFLNDWAAGC